MENYIIAGGGLAGLTAANALADAGRKVTVLEQSEHLGGRAITRQEDGFFLNLGPHALYCGGPAMRTIKEWKIPFAGHPPAQGAGYLVYRGEKYPLIRGIASLLRSPLFGFAEKLETARLLRLFGAGRAPQQTMQSWIDDQVRSPRVRDLAAAITRLSTFVADLDHLSAPAALRQIAMAFSTGVLYLDHGWQTLIDGLAARARSLGVEIRCGAHASMDAHRVILAVPPASVETITGASLPNLRPVRVACLDLGLTELSAKAATFGLGVDRPLYYSVHSASAELAPDGSALIHVAKYLAAEGEPVADRAELEQFADLLAPGWRDRVSMARFLPSMTVSHGMATPEGRPGIDALSQRGVVVAGDWVGPDNMLADAAVASALCAASMVQGSKSARNAA